MTATRGAGTGDRAVRPSADMFIFDGVIHVHDLHPSNLVLPDGETANHNMYRSSTRTFPEDLRFADYDDFARTWQPDDIHRIVFDESDTDLAMVQAVPLFDAWRDGLAPVRLQAELAARHPEQILFVGAVDPVFHGVREACDEMRRQVDELGAVSFKFYNAHTRGRSWRCDDPDVAYPLYRTALDKGIDVIQFHKGLALGLERIEDLRPNDLQAAAVEFPEMNFVIHHLGMPYTEETIDIGRRFPNVYLSLSTWVNQLALRPAPTTRLLCDALFSCGPEKLLWGSEVPLWPAAQPLIDLFLGWQVPDEYQDQWGVAPLDDDDRAAIMGGNLARLFGVEIPDRYRR